MNQDNEMKLKELKEIRSRFEQFKHVNVSETVIKTFSQYMKDVFVSKQFKKPKQRDLGLAAIDSHVIFT